jgi:hypothetical protein
MSATVAAGSAVKGARKVPCAVMGGMDGEAEGRGEAEADSPALDGSIEGRSSRLRARIFFASECLRLRARRSGDCRSDGLRLELHTRNNHRDDIWRTTINRNT